MDDSQRVEFLRCQAHECRMRAAMTEQREAKQRWLDFARDYEGQADHIRRMSPHSARNENK